MKDFKLILHRKGNSYRIDYRIRGDVNYRHTVSYVATPHANYNPLTMENDIAMLIIPQSSNRFPYDCIAKVGDRMYLPTGIRMAVTIVGHGFTTPDDTEMSRVPYYANYTTDSNRDSCNISAPTVLCLFGGNQCVLCNGDVGSGIFAYDAGKPILVRFLKVFLTKILGMFILFYFYQVGIVSNLPNTYCTYSGTILYSSYTAVGFFEEWIQTITGFY